MTGAVTHAMRVLRVAHHGVVTPWRQRERELRKQHVDVTLVSAKRWNEGGKNIDLHAGQDHFVTGVRTFGTHPNAFVYSPVPLWKLLGQRWDLIDLHEEPFSLAAAQVLAMRRLRGLRTPFVLYSAQNIYKRYPVPFRWFERYALRRTAGVYVCNSEAGEILQRKGLRAPARLIGLGTDVSVFTPSERQRPQTPVRVGFAGRLESHKGAHVLLTAISEAPQYQLDIAGDGPQRPELEALADTLGIADQVAFRGHLGDQLPDFYRELDVLVVPSLPTPGWLEQFGRVVIEAFASGVPVIASRTGALQDVVADAGILVEPGDPQAIREALAVVTDTVRWSTLRDAGLHRAQQFDWPSIATEQLTFYQEALTPVDNPEAPPEIVVVAYGPAEPLADAIRPLTGFSITIVDNSSSAETRDVAELYGAHYIDPGGNLGFAAGVNMALDSLEQRGLSTSDVLLLNPDATVTAESIRSLHVGLHENPHLACVAPVQKHPRTGVPERVSWPFPGPGAAWLEAIGLGRLNNRAGFIIGSVLLLRGSALADVGRFDERFFLYAEETDWQLRAVKRGWKTGLVSEATATHVGAGTGGDSVRRMEMFNTSLLAFMDKHYGRTGEFSFRAAVLAGALARAAVARGDTRDRAKWRLRFYTRAPRAGGVGER
ncbi:glycosyltransferase [Nesterenkonia salmonea]|uniref:D-inositol 3-phosphate glycosyltransferase n=1 Tax=Nesterenkonia salmonea TaxID=1804987 RepID=A0A5R9BAN7_9MICC|nr:glycosyltransferase [Nesterenkonia salmonea]TLP97044.1 glycosyltransferase [Nesterenkonia salmonea]